MINKDCEKDKGMTVVVHTKSQKNRLKMNPVHDCGECKPCSFERPLSIIISNGLIWLYVVKKSGDGYCDIDITL